MSETRTDPVLDGDCFVITPENAASFETRLFGFGITDDGRIITDEDDDRTAVGPNGCWVLLERDGGHLSIRQDFVGCWGLFLYRDGGWWALSNSFLFLVEYLRAQRRPLTFDKVFGDHFLFYSLATLSLERTMATEIKLLDRSASVTIDIASGALSTSLTDYRENTVPLDGPEGIALIDSWHERWVGFICDVIEKMPVTCDLSGGMDSRTVFTLFLDPRVDRSRVRFKSKKTRRAMKIGDWEVASRVAEAAGIELNQRRDKSSSPFDFDEGLELMLRCRGFDHHNFDDTFTRFEKWGIGFKGSGGETRRRHWGDGTEEGARAAVELLATRARWLYASDGEDIEASVRTMLEESLRGIGEKFSSFGRALPPEKILAENLHRETRCRSHFGGKLRESWCCGTLHAAPLLDHELQRIALTTDDCDDTNLLFALIIDRFAPELAGIDFQGGRSIAGETFEMARELNRRFPLEGPCGEAVARARADGRAAAGQVHGERGERACGDGDADGDAEREGVDLGDTEQQRGGGDGSGNDGSGNDGDDGEDLVALADGSKLHVPSVSPALRMIRCMPRAGEHGSKRFFYRVLSDAAGSPRVRESFTRLYAPQTYRAIYERASSNGFHSEGPALALLCVAWLREVCDGTLGDGVPGDGVCGDGTLSGYIIENARALPALPADITMLPAVSELAQCMTARIAFRRLADEPTMRGVRIEEADGVDVDIVTYALADGIFARSGTGHARFVVSIDGGGTLQVELGAEKMHDVNGRLVDHWIDYTSLTVNGEVLLEEGRYPASEKEPLVFTRDVADGGTAVLEVSWLCHDPKVNNLEAERRQEMREKLQAARDDCRKKNGELAELRSSRAYRIGSKICLMTDKLGRIFKRG